jgi:hypothetical protein
MEDKGKKRCQSLKIKKNFAEIEDGSETAVGEEFSFPVYDFYTDEPLGTYTESATYIFVGGEIADMS